MAGGETREEGWRYSNRAPVNTRSGLGNRRANLPLRSPIKGPMTRMGWDQPRGTAERDGHTDTNLRLRNRDVAGRLSKRNTMIQMDRH